MSTAATENKALVPAPATAVAHNTTVAHTKLANDVRGVLKAGLLLLSIDEDVAIQILGQLTEQEILRLRDAIGTLGKTAPEQLAAIHSEFQKNLHSHVLHVRGGTDYLTRLAMRAHGEEKIQKLLVSPQTLTKAAPELAKANAKTLWPLLEKEHPQVIAAVLASLDVERATQLLKRMPEQLRADVVHRVATMTKIPGHIMAIVEKVLSAGLPVSNENDTQVEGVKIAATLLNKLGAEFSDKVLTSVNERSGKLGSDIRQAMFTFEDLGRLDRKNFQVLLKEIQNDQLLLALKTATDSLKDKIFGCISKRAADMLREDLEMLGPQRLADVEKAQSEIVATALQLRTSGKLTLMDGGGDYV